ncbi:MAG: DUF4199 domain-containing protein [Salibacteraceae bacterium]|jgi:hypothetical protein|nr:DUF4199 domain-containing protein [Salibacteraceae bacterium]MDP4762956.1 DUF4199 domain-containing protein [Salibacteraceae bacterium]MDP4844451.1 DUF4199 domain-containing protein [Salibacteraceae bacterium]MDP4933337.1 DUF4199 domain-containing protein [Salibacteraceae bacterium]MDP4965518.1 DUF4199 domain-containing protein [Salibacteraceae bacterium]
MKNPIVNFAFTAALASIVLKMLYYIQFYPNDEFDMYVRFAYLLFFLLALFLGMRTWKSQNDPSEFTEDMKAGMKIASIYAMMVSAFTYAYYKFINPNYFEYKISENLRLASESGEDVDLDKVKETVSFIFDAFFHSTITLFGLIFIGLFYTIVIVAILRYKPEIYRD